MRQWKAIKENRINWLALKEILGEKKLRCYSYFGGDLIDLPCMRPIKDAGGVAGCPAKEGEGALREFAEWLVKPQINSVEIKRKVDLALSHLRHRKVSEADVGKKCLLTIVFIIVFWDM